MEQNIRLKNKQNKGGIYCHDQLHTHKRKDDANNKNSYHREINKNL